MVISFVCLAEELDQSFNSSKFLWELQAAVDVWLLAVMHTVLDTAVLALLC